MRDLPYGTTRAAIVRALRRQLQVRDRGSRVTRTVLDVILDPTGYEVEEKALEWGTVLIARQGGVV